MDGILRQLKADRLKMLDKAEHRRLGEGRSRLGKLLRGVALGTGAMRHMDLRGHDLPAGYNYRAFENAYVGLREFLGDEIDAARTALKKTFDPDAPKILVIQRGDADPFYLSQSAEAKSAGTARRSIPNHLAMVDAMSARLGPLLNMKLEGLPLAEQVALFSSADIIVAQHGAALSNLIWARPGTCVVEIMPKTMPKETQDTGFFSNLARCMRLRHRFAWQEHDHSAVDPQSVCGAIDEMLALPCRQHLGIFKDSDRPSRQMAG